jgi:ribosomal protein S12 methylthiotransferase accessory factor
MPDVMPPSAHSALPWHYELRLQETTASAGYFACRPVDAPDWNEALVYLKEHPLDDFMRTYLLGQIGAFEPQRLAALIDTTPAEEAALRALWYEACLLFESFLDLMPLFKASEHEVLARATGLVYIKASLAADHGVHKPWIPLVHANHYDHQLLPDPSTLDLKHPFTSAILQGVNKVVCHLAEVVAATEAEHPPTATLSSPEETAAKALEKLNQAGVLAGEEMRHVSSLSLYGLLRKWRFGFPVRCGRHAFEFAGTQTAYGRGLSLETARASYAMEIVERCSAFAGFGPDGPEGYARAYPLVNATYNELQAQGRRALDPNTLPLEAPYTDDRLYWMQGQLRTTDGMESILIPCQCSFLFSNLDEVSLFSGLGSTGLASGNTMA